jgi:hypothetical protein
MSEAWEEPELTSKKSSTYGVYQVDKLSRPFTLISQEEIIKRQKNSVREISDEIGISLTLARAILIKYGWNKD